MKRVLIIGFVLILVLSVSFVSANFFDWMTGHDVRQVSSESGAKYNLEIKSAAPVGSGKNFVRGTITRPDGIQEEISAHTGEEVILQRGEVVSVSKTPTNKPFGRKNIEVSIQENKLEEVEGILFFSHFHENVGTIDEKSGDEYYLYSGDNSYKIEIAPEDEIMNMKLEQMIGKNIKVSGLKKDNAISIKSVSASTKLKDSAKRLTQTGDAEFRKPFSPPIIDKPIPAIKNQTRYKMAVFLIDFQDSGARPFSRSEAEEKIFGNSAGSLRSAILEQSYNKASVTGQVFDWITVPRNSLDLPTTYSTTAISQRCYAMDWASPQFVQEEVFPLIPQTTKDELLKEYNRIYFFTYCPQYQLNLGGYANYFDIDGDFSNEKGNIVGGFTMFNFNNFPSAWNSLIKHTEHEFIHLVIAPRIIWHASALDCGEKIIGADKECSFLEAGNCYDVMGKVLSTGLCSEHVNSGYKEDIGWLSARDILTITQSGIYTIGPLESSNKKDRKAAKIESKNFDITPFYLEFRQPIGKDSNLNNFDLSSNKEGLFIYYAGMLLDARPSAFSWNDDLKDVTLNIGEIFADNLTGITIEPISVFHGPPKSPQISFNVTIPPPSSLCGSNAKPFKTISGFFDDVDFVDANNGWIIKEYGNILYSNNGGNSWQDIHSTTKDALFFPRMDFINNSAGWVAGLSNDGSEGLILYTADGGKNWIVQQKIDNFWVQDVQFIDHSIGWVIGYDLGTNFGKVFKTIDGGQTWQEKSLPKISYKSSFIDANNGWIINGENFNKEIYSTNDGGETWHLNNLSDLFPDTYFMQIYFLNQDTGFIAGVDWKNVGGTVIFKTIDGGQTWSLINSISGYSPNEIYFSDENNGWITGNEIYSNTPVQSMIFSTNNGGETLSKIFETEDGIGGVSSSSFKNGLWLNTGREIYCLNNKLQQETLEGV